MKWFLVKLETRELQRHFRSLVTSYIILKTTEIRFYKVNTKHLAAEYYISIPDVLVDDFSDHMKNYNLFRVDEPDLKNCMLISGGSFFRKMNKVRATNPVKFN